MENSLENENSTLVFQMVEALLRKLEQRPGSRIGNILRIEGTYGRRSGMYYFLPPTINRNTYLIIHHDTVHEQGRNGRIENLLGAWEVFPENAMILARGFSNLRSEKAFDDASEIVHSALANCTNRKISTQPFWDLMTGLAMMDNQDRKTALAITKLPGFNSSDADEIPA